MLRKICSLSGPASIMPHFPKIYDYFFSFIFDYYICQMYNIPTKKLQDGHLYQTQISFASLDLFHATYFLASRHWLSSASPTRQFCSRPCGSTAWGCSTQRTLAPFYLQTWTTHPLRVWICYPECPLRETLVIQWSRC